MCSNGNDEVLATLRNDPAISLVFTSAFSSAYTWSTGSGSGERRTGDQALEAGTRKYADALAAAGKELIVIPDVPAVKDQKNAPDCLAATDNVRTCGLARAEG